MKNIMQKLNKFMVARLVISLVFVGFFANPAIAAPQGTLEGRCVGNTIYLEWGSHPNANSNGLQKADVLPNDPNRFWDWLPVGDSARSYTDYNITPGQTYSYRVKYRPELPSNVVTLTCQNTTPPPSLPTINIYANPQSVSYNGTSSVIWNSSGADSCSGSGGSNGWSGSKSTSGSFYTGFLTNTTTYNITCSNSAGSTNASTTVSVGGQQQLCQDPSAINYGGPLPCQYNNQNFPPNVNIYADDTNLDYDDSTTIRWNSTSATYCYGRDGDNGWSGSKSTSGSFYTGRLDEDTTYEITCTNNYGTDTDSVTVRVDGDDYDDDEAPEVTTRNATNISSTNATLNGRVDGNGNSTRAWFEYGFNTNFGYSTRERSYGSSSSSFDERVTGLRANTLYYFRAVAENSEDLVYGNILSFYTGNDNIYIPPVQPPVVNNPAVVVSADSTNIAYGAGTTIRWYTYNVDSCYASGGGVGWAGARNTGPGSFYTGSLTSTRTFTLTCSNGYGTTTDSVTVGVRGQVLGTTTPATSLVLISSSVDRNQPIVPTLDNTRPHPGDEINYTVSYKNVGTGSITNLNLRVDLPYEVEYMFSNPSNPTRVGQTLNFNLGTLRANGEGMVTIRVRVRDNVALGTHLNFPAVLSYVDPAGNPQSVNANVSAQIWNQPEYIIYDNNTNNGSVLGANTIWGAGFFPDSLFEWLFLLILILILIILARHIFSQRETTHVVEHH